MSRRKHFRKWGAIRQNIRESFKTYVLAVSGGSDSMMMLDLFRRMGDVEFVVAHFNHGDRYELDDRDEKFVTEYCFKHHIPIYIGHGDGEKILKARSLEMESRIQRYTFLKKVLRDLEYDRIVCAHNANDQVEGVLMRLTRGFNIDNLTMKVDNGFVFRPFLEVTTEQVYENCRYHQIPFVEDETNLDTSRLRNWFRHVIIPQINERCPTHVVAKTAAKYNRKYEEAKYLQEFVNECTHVSTPVMCHTLYEE